MIQVSRRLLVTSLTASALPLFNIKTARAADTIFKYGNSLQTGNPLTGHMQTAADKIANESGGRLQIQLYPAAALGGDTEMLSQLRAGGMQCMTLSAGVLSTLVPLASINEVPFAFNDFTAVQRAMDGDVGAMVRAAIAKTRLVPMDKMWDSGFRQVTSSRRPIVTPDDLRGLKIRVPVFQMATAMFRSLGASPVSINSSEMYSALQTKIADGQENSLTNIETFKLYEIQTYVSMTNHMWDGYWFLFNGDAWNHLPKDVQDIAAKHLNEGAVQERTAMETLNGNQRGTLEKQGMKFNEVDVQPFRAKLKEAGFYADWQKRFGAEPWAALERYTGSLA
jgi:tripartite ATP-independent transporter DctP family solute receptor